MFKIIIFIFGVIGFAYEALFNRTISTVFGSLVYIQGTILFSFILFAGVGALLSDKLRKHLIFIMLSLLAFSSIMLIYWQMQAKAPFEFIPGIPARVFITFLLTAPGALLIGTIIPILTDLQIINTSYKRRSSFLITYLFYHLGAGLIVVLLDLLLVPFLGITQCIVLLCLTILASTVVLFLSKIDYNGSISSQKLIREDFNIICLIGFISGVLQLGVLKTHIHFFGPFSENFTFVIATTIISLGLSSYIVKKGFINKANWLMWLAPFLVIYLFYIWGGVYVVAFINENVHATVGFYDKALRFILIFLLYFPIYTAFGCLLPVMHSSSSFSTKNGLALNSIANAIGILVAMLFVYQIVPLKWVFICCAFILLGYQSIKFNSSKKSQILISISIALLIVWIVLFKNIIFHFSFRFFDSIHNMTHILENAKSYTSYRKGGAEVTFIHAVYGDIVVIDGYKTMTINKTVKSKITGQWLTQSQLENDFEFFVGAMQAFLSKGHKNSFIVGLGTGLTVSANSLFYERIDAVEINEAILSIQHIFNEYNFGLLERDNVYSHFDDGYNYLLKSDQNYDLIISNVPTPQYSVASKIWTYDFFKLTKMHLNPGGIFSMWVNGAMNPKAIEIVLKSLSQVYEHCYVGFIHSMYSNIMCSNQPIKVNTPNYVKSGEDINNYNKKYTLNEISYLLFPIESFKKFDDDIHLNTLNRPILPYYLDPLLMKNWVKNKSWFILDYINVDVSNYAKKEMTKRCRLLKEISLFDQRQPPDFCN